VVRPSSAESLEIVATMAPINYGSDAEVGVEVLKLSPAQTLDGANGSPGYQWLGFSRATVVIFFFSPAFLFIRSVRKFKQRRRFSTRPRRLAVRP
jgi:hypothetical protein